MHPIFGTFIQRLPPLVGVCVNPMRLIIISPIEQVRDIISTPMGLKGTVIGVKIIPGEERLALMVEFPGISQHACRFSVCITYSLRTNRVNIYALRIFVNIGSRAYPSRSRLGLYFDRPQTFCEALSKFKGKACKLVTLAGYADIPVSS
jgi:hypothetical protein